MLAWRRFAFTSLWNGSSKVVYRFPTVNLSQAVSQLRCSVGFNSLQEEETGAGWDWLTRPVAYWLWVAKGLLGREARCGMDGGRERGIVEGQGWAGYSWWLRVWSQEGTGRARASQKGPLPVGLGVADVMALISKCHLTPSVAPSLKTANSAELWGEFRHL